MNILIKLWNFINGHKTQAMGFISLLIGFATTKGLLDSDTSVFLLSIASLLFGSAVFHSEKKKVALKKKAE